VKIFLNIIILIIFCNNLFAQKEKKIETKIINTIGVVIANANGTLYAKKDSSYITSGFSNNKGVLILSALPQPSFLVITKDSFNTRVYPIDSTFNIDTVIFLLKKDNQLEDAVVFANPITYKEDTVQFSNALFKNDSLKTLEEVLKKFPGVTMDREGNIEINGQKVSEILLDGEPLPTNDIQQLIQSLQAGLIDKIQFIDKKPDEARFNRVDNGVRKKAINIKLKNKSKKSLNQHYYIGYGTQKRYEANADINHIYDKWYTNASLKMNNSGRRSFNNINYYSNNGISSGFSGNILTRYAVGEKLIFNLGYQSGVRETILEENRNRTIFLKDSLSYFQQALDQESNSNSHNITSTLTIRPDSTSEWKANINATFNNGNNERAEIFANQNNSKIPTNNGQRTTTSFNKNHSLILNISGGKRAKDRRNAIYGNLTGTLGAGRDQSVLQNNILYYRTLGIGYDTTKQRIKNQNENKSIVGNITFYRDIAKDFTVNINASINYNEKPINRTAYLYNYFSNEFTIANTNLFNNVLNTTNYLATKIGLSRIYKSHNMSAFVALNKQLNKNLDFIKDTTLLQNAFFVTPSITYVFNNKKHYFSNNITFTQRTPTTQQLQPIVDDSNPLFTKKGNPDLKNEKNITANSTFRNMQNGKQKSNFINYTFTQNLTITQNRIANNTFFDSNEGKQVNIPINLPQALLFSNDGTFTYFLAKRKLNLSSRLFLLYNKSNNFLNGQLNDLTFFNFKPSIGVKKNTPKFEIDAHIGYNYQTNKYSLRPEQNIKFGTLTSDASFWYAITNNLDIRFDYQQTVNNNVRRSIQRINNLNGRLGYKFKYKKWPCVFSIQAFDILNQNSNILQNISDYYEETITSIAIRKFYLASFSVRFNQFKGAKKTNNSGAKKANSAKRTN
jgi:hypothetical protein